MPIGKFASFDSCVVANRDKRNPQAYCATIERTIHVADEFGRIHLYDKLIEIYHKKINK